MHPETIKTAPPLRSLWLFAYIAFIIYGSLVPLDFHPHALASAWEQFQHTRMLDLGLGSRADWIANGVLYFPAGFLLAERFIGRVHGPALACSLFFSLLALCGLAFGVEFAQLFFPPRTVSQNDLLAETIGGALGLLLALPLANAARRVTSFRPAHGAQAASLMLIAYMVAYLAYCFFPFDFLLSAPEIANKLASDHWGILFARSQQGFGFRTLVTIALEVAIAIPFGVFIAPREIHHHPINRAGAALRLPVLTLPLIAYGLALGLGIEVIQFFTYSGISQGSSVLTRMLGVCCGSLLWTRWANTPHTAWRAWLKRRLSILLALYLLGLVLFAITYTRPWGNLATAQNALSALHLLPFYYHYYVSESNALTSLVSVALLFAPLGVLASASRVAWLLSLVAPVVLSALIETTKLFSTTHHADPTNILIAVVTARLAYRLLYQLTPETTAATPLQPTAKPSSGQLPLSSRPPSPTPGNHFPTPSPSVKAPSKPQLALLLALAIGIAVWLASFPVHPGLLAILFLASTTAVWCRPVSALLIIPAALPILDLAPWSGRFYLDEFDTLLALALAVGYIRTVPAREPCPPLIKAVLVLLGVSFVLSSLRALIPWQPIDENAFITYFSQFNALRISKGLVWALLFAGLMHRLTIRSGEESVFCSTALLRRGFISAEKSAFRWFAWGMTLGLAAVVTVMVREKIMFGGLLNFSSDYRATGPFSAIHTGGAYVECYLAVAAPFLLYLILTTHRWLLRIAGAALLLASTYALMATVSRNGFAGYAVACGLALLALMAGQEKKLKRLMQIALLAGAALAVAVPLFEGSFVQKRMSEVGNDLGVRTAHWQDGLSLRDDDWLTGIFGMGIGRFPDTHFWRSREPFHPSIHALGREAGNTFLRIAPGNTLYIEQIVAIEPHQRYRLRFKLRSAASGTTVGVALCEKWMLASSRCAAWNKSQGATQAGVWQPVEQSIDSGELGGGRWFSQRPVKLSFFTNGSAVVDVDDIQLIPEHGANRIANADFSHGMDHWYFATDEHLAWHIKSMPMAILFDQGWFGILAFGLFFILVFRLAGRAAWHGNPAAGVSLAATTGFLVVGIFDTLIDAPRFLFLLFALALFAAHGFVDKEVSSSSDASDKLHPNGPD